MGIDFDSLWGKAVDAADNALDNLVKTGVPALQASAEKWAIDVLTEQNKKTVATLNNNVKEVLSQPTTTGSFGAAVADTLKQSAQQNYGMWIVGGLGAAVLVGVMLSKR